MNYDVGNPFRGSGSVSRAIKRKKVENPKKKKRLEKRLKLFQKRNPDRRYKIVDGNIILDKKGNS